MSSIDPPRSSQMILVALVALVVGIVVAQLLPSDLFGLRDTPARQSSSDSPDTHEHGEEATLYTCSMHPEVLEEEPGECPICGMDLVAVSANAAGSSDHVHDEVAEGPGLYTCPMHPEILEEEFGECPICGMDLVAVSTDGAGPSDHVHEEVAEGPTLYTCPMHPEILEEEPGECPICGMDLVDATPGKTGLGEGAGGMMPMVEIDPRMVQTMNVRTQPAERRDLTQPIRTVGYLEYDQQRMVTVTTKYSGFVEKVFVNYIGEEVRRGQALFEIYSPELVQTQQDLLSALDFAAQLADAPEDARLRAEAMVDAARTRLGYWDISQEQIDQLESSGEVFRTLKVSAPASGLVMKRMAGLEGMAVTPGMELFHVADLSSLWLSVELFEDQVAWVRQGTTADIELSYFPGESFRGSVRFLEPELSDRTRTIRAKIEVQNPGGRLRTGMYATVEFKAVLVKNALAVPSEAVLRTGTRSVVVVAQGEGRFQPREVQIGHEAGGYTQILQGLEEDAVVVTSAQFLLDSESNLKEAIQKLIASRS